MCINSINLEGCVAVGFFGHWVYEPGQVPPLWKRLGQTIKRKNWFFGMEEKIKYYLVNQGVYKGRLWNQITLFFLTVLKTRPPLCVPVLKLATLTVWSSPKPPDHYKYCTSCKLIHRLQWEQYLLSHTD
jgi:hypothetical protein